MLVVFDETFSLCQSDLVQQHPCVSQAFHLDLNQTVLHGFVRVFGDFVKEDGLNF